MISESTISEATEFLNTIKKPSWVEINSESQDGGEFVLFSVKTNSSDYSIQESFRSRIVAGIGALIPPKPTGDYSWMVVFVNGEDVCESVMGNLEIDHDD